jgi:hypothetical protein
MEQVISEEIDRLTLLLHEVSLKVGKEQALKIWNQQCTLMQMKDIPDKLPPHLEEKKKKKDEVKKEGKCIFILESGTNKGNKCPIKVSEKSTTGLYCHRHLKHDNDDKPKEDKDMKIVKNKYGNFEHKDSSLIFNSDHKVYGKQKGDKVVVLDEKDIEMCKKLKFDYIDTTAKPEKEDSDNEEEIPKKKSPEVKKQKKNKSPEVKKIKKSKSRSPKKHPKKDKKKPSIREKSKVNSDDSE